MRKNVVKGFQPFQATSLAANATSPEVNVINLDKASIYVDWAGTSPVGTLAVEAKNREDGDWFALDFGSPISISGNSGNHLIVLNELPFLAIRLVYTAGSGTGTIDAVIAAKTVGA